MKFIHWIIKLKKTTGEDGILADVVKKCSDKLNSHKANISNMLRIDCYIRKLKLSIIIPIQKGGMILMNFLYQINEIIVLFDQKRKSRSKMI